MNKLIDVKLKYSSPAVPPKTINMTTIYTLKKDDRGYYIYDGGLEQAFEIELIQMMFTPIGATWDELTKVEVKVVKKSEDKVTDKE
jgi:hypothetical protein